MGRVRGTEVMDAAVSAMTMTAAEVFQVAAGMENARTPALGNWLNESPENRRKLDDMMRRGVAQVAKELHANGWDYPEEADAFDRFQQEMLAYNDEDYALWLEKKQAEAESSEEALAWSHRLRAHNQKGKR